MLFTITTQGPRLSRDVSWPGHCRSSVFLAKDYGETWCGDRGETGLKGFVHICAKERWECFSYHGPFKQRSKQIGHAKKSTGKNVKDGRAKGHLQHSKASHYQGSGDFQIYPLPYLRFVVKLEGSLGDFSGFCLLTSHALGPEGGHAYLAALEGEAESVGLGGT